MYQIFNIRWEKGIDLYSNILVLICICILVSITLVVIITYYNHPSTYTPETKTSTISKNLMKDFKSNNKMCFLEHITFIIRRTLLCFIILLLPNHNLIQCLCFLIICILVLICKIYIRAYRHWILNFQDIYLELSLLLITIIYFKFLNEDTQGTKEGISHYMGYV